MAKKRRSKTKIEFRRMYEKWWLGKWVSWPNQPWKKVVSLKLHGPPSFVYGEVEFTFEDGSKARAPKPQSIDYAGVDHTPWRPRKQDVIATDHDPTAKPLSEIWADEQE